jgi:hypothetical protein
MRSHEGIVNDYILYIGRALEEGIDVHVIYKAVRRKVEPDALMEMLETGIPSDLTSALVDGLRKDCKKMDKAAVIKIARAVGQRKEITVADEEEVIRRLDYCYDEEGVAVLIDALRKEFRHHKDEEPDSATVAATT